jgi:hypothetical protein
MLKIIALVTLIIASSFPRAEPSAIWAEITPFFEQKLVQEYRAPVHQYSSGHRGIDLRIPLGDPVVAPEAGEIIFSDQVVDRNVVTLLTDSGHKASFEPVCASVAVGTFVTQGDPLGVHCQPEVSYQYHCSSCVHASARSSFGYLSPLFLMGKLEPSVLIA